MTFLEMRVHNDMSCDKNNNIEAALIFQYTMYILKLNIAYSFNYVLGQSLQTSKASCFSSASSLPVASSIWRAKSVMVRP